jgi:hypothetical protein
MTNPLIRNAKHSQHRLPEGDFRKASIAAKLKISWSLEIQLLNAVIVLLPLVVVLLTFFAPKGAIPLCFTEKWLVFSPLSRYLGVKWIFTCFYSFYLGVRCDRFACLARLSNYHSPFPN